MSSLPPTDASTAMAGEQALRELEQRARAAGTLALDTEFMGEGRYRTLLCLIQLAAPGDGGGEQIELVDALAPGMEREPLAGLLEDPDVETIVHAGRQDIALLRRALRCEVQNVFDTQVAAGFVGLPAQCSYDTLLSELLGVKVAKSASFTRWDARPLSDEQLSYAREDVVHLLELASELQRRLRQSGRLQWAREECRGLAQASDERDLDTIFARLPRVRGLSPASQAVARELVQWRERTAAESDRPVQSVLADNTLVEIAKRRPGSLRRLQEIRGIGQAAQRRRGEQVLSAVERGSQREHEPLPAALRPALPQPQDAPLVALCEALVRMRAREADLAYELLASRADLQAIVIGERTGRRAAVRTLSGWRNDLVGRELVDLLDGRVSIAVRDGRAEVRPVE